MIDTFEWIRKFRAATHGTNGEKYTLPTKAVGIWLITWMNPDGTSAFPSHETIALGAGCSTSTVKKALGILEAEGWLKKVRQGGSPAGGTKISNEYETRLPHWVPTELGRVATGLSDKRALGRPNEGTGSCDTPYQPNTNSTTNDFFDSKMVASSDGENFMFCDSTKKWVALNEEGVTVGS